MNKNSAHWIVRHSEGDGWYLDIRDPAKKVETTVTTKVATSEKVLN